MRILVVEDDAEAATAMVRGLSEAGHEVTHAVDGAFGLLESQKGGYDVYVVDRMMPRLDGVGMVETIRKGGDQTPVLFLSALGEVEDRVTGLKAGGDDYLVKPFEMDELLARCRALLRRPGSCLATVLTAGNVAFDTVSRRISVGGRAIDAPRRELDLMEILLRRVGQVVTRPVLEESLYGFNDEVTPNALEAHVSRLRRRLAEAGADAVIHTVRGVGYLLRTAEAA